MTAHHVFTVVAAFIIVSPVLVFAVMALRASDWLIDHILTEDRLGPTLNPPGSDTIEFLIHEGENKIGPVESWPTRGVH